MAARACIGNPSAGAEGGAMPLYLSGRRVRMRGCILEYRRAIGGYFATEGAFCGWFSTVATWVCGLSDYGGICTWIAHGVGEPVVTDARGVLYDGYDVVAHVPSSAEFEGILCATLSGDSKWTCHVAKSVDDGPYLDRWVVEQEVKRAPFRCFGTGFGWLCPAKRYCGESGLGLSVDIGTQTDGEESRPLLEEDDSLALAVSRDSENSFCVNRCEAKMDMFSPPVVGVNEHHPDRTGDGLGSSWRVLDGVDVRRSCRSHSRN
jgi:hypothetical protein